MTFEETLRFVERVFEGKRDKGGEPYIKHLLAVANGVESETEKIVALLHDSIEDIEEIDGDYLRKLGYSKEIVEAVEILTKKKGEDYTVYLERVKQNPIARKVKLADLKHNSDISRLKEVTEKDIKRLEKYKFAIKFLEKE